MQLFIQTIVVIVFFFPSSINNDNNNWNNDRNFADKQVAGWTFLLGNKL